VTSVSVIIPAYKAQATLPRVLRALERQITKGDDREVVVVDSTGVDDGTLVRWPWPWAQVVAVPRRLLPGRGRNLGASVARGELLAFLDADAIPEPGWLDELELAMGSGVEMVAGAILNGTPNEHWGTVAYALEFLEWTPERQSPLAHAASCNLLIRRTAFERAGGFPEDLWPGEDTVLSVPFAAKGTLVFAPKAQVSHLNRVGRREVLAHQRRLGASWVQVCERALLPGQTPAVSRLAPIVVAARAWYLVLQLRRRQDRLLRLASHGPQLAAGFVAWGVGVFRSEV
jgi:GT2 family glycosyltransferase